LAASHSRITLRPSTTSKHCTTCANLRARRARSRNWTFATCIGSSCCAQPPRPPGRYVDHCRFVLTDAGRHAFSSPAEVPALVTELAKWLSTAPAAPDSAFTAHRQLVGIHPFHDRNGRTARLLMNLILIRGGYRWSRCGPKTTRPISVPCNRNRPGGRGRIQAPALPAIAWQLGECLSALWDAQPDAQSPPSRRGGDEPAPCFVWLCHARVPPGDKSESVDAQMRQLTKGGSRALRGRPPDGTHRTLRHLAGNRSRRQVARLSSAARMLVSTITGAAATHGNAANSKVDTAALSAPRRLKVRATSISAFASTPLEPHELFPALTAAAPEY
jgi:Fic/DOC family